MNKEQTSTVPKTVLITGGSSGIGYELALLFAADGYRLFLVAKDAKKLHEAAASIKSQYPVTALVHDLSESQAAKDVYAAIQKEQVTIDVLINNAGFATYGKFVETDYATELQELNVNIVSLTNLTKLVAQDMVAANSGKILMVSSMAGFLPGPLMAVYYASKSYVLSFSQAIRKELAPSRVTVSVLCPGPTDTGFATRGGLTKSSPFQGSLATAKDVAKVAYDGLMQNKSIIIPGIRNQLIARIIPFIPRGLLLTLVHRYQSQKTR